MGSRAIRGYRFSAQQLLELLAAGKSFDEIHESFDFLEVEDAHHVLGYAAALADRDFYLPTAQPAGSSSSTRISRHGSLPGSSPPDRTPSTPPN